MTNRRSMIRSSVALALVLTAGSSFTYFHIASQESARQEAAASAPEYIYAVAPATNKVLTYSLLPDSVKQAGDGFQVKYGYATGVAKVSWDGCWYSFLKSCPKPVASLMIISHPNGDVRQNVQSAGNSTTAILPRIVWHDGNGQFQQQFFKNGEVVYVSDHPLPTDDDDVLTVVPQVNAPGKQG